MSRGFNKDTGFSSTGGLFGSTNKEPAPTTNKPEVALIGTKPSSFGAATTYGNNSSQSIFGATPSTNISSKSLFGAAPNANDSRQSGFNKDTGFSSTGGLFGSTNKEPAPTTNKPEVAFGTKPSSFGAATTYGNNSSQSIFGATPSTNISSKSLFGASPNANDSRQSGFNKDTGFSSTGGLFGSTNKEPAPTTNKPEVAFGTKPSSFGAATTYGNNSSQSIFGATPSTNISSKSLFGAAPNANDSRQSLFGASPSTNNSSQSLFDAAPSANGNNNSQPLFGKTGTIGGSIGCEGLFEGCKEPTPGTKIKFEPPSGQDSMVKNGQTTSINTKHQCITAMKQYEDKSVEELRFEDWVEGVSFKIDRGTMHYCGEPKHFMLKKEFYCNDCSTAICKKCLTGCHKKHDCDELETMGKASRVKLKSLKKPYKEEILTQRKFLDALVDQRMKMKHEAKIACQKVDERANKFRQAVTKIVKKLKRITAASLDKNEELLSKSMTSINFKISQLDRDSVSKVSDKKSNLECIEYLHRRKKTLEDNKATSEELVVPTLQTTEFHAGDIDRNLLVKMFGKIGEDATLTDDDGDDDDTDDDDDDTGLSSTGGLFGSFNNKAKVPFGTIPEFGIRTAPTTTEPKLLLGTNPTLGISKAPTTNEPNVPFGTNSSGTFGFSTSDNKSRTSSQLGITPKFGMFSLDKTSACGFGAAPSTNNKNCNSSLFGNMEPSGGNTALGFCGPSVFSASSKAKTPSFTGFSFETTKQTGTDATDTRKNVFSKFVERPKRRPALKITSGISTLRKEAPFKSELRYCNIYCGKRKHLMLKKEYYCNDCSTAVCKKCITDSHKKHDFDDLETVGEARRRELESLKWPYEEEIFKQRKFLASFEDQRMTMKHGSKIACQKVDDRTNTICEAVKAIGEKIKQQSVASLDKNEEILSKSIKSINLKVSQLDPNSISKVLDEKSDLECIEYLPRCKKTLEDNKATPEELVVPTLQTAEFHADDIDRNLLVKMFGKIVEDATLTHDDDEDDDGDDDYYI